ncbi:hypothetical protein Tco_0757552 [Tanacetum coccineum]
MAEISMTIAKLLVFYKQRDFLFFPTWVYALPSWFVNIHVLFVEAALWTNLTYHVMGLDPNIWREIIGESAYVAGEHKRGKELLMQIAKLQYLVDSNEKKVEVAHGPGDDNLKS